MNSDTQYNGIIPYFTEIHEKRFFSGKVLFRVKEQAYAFNWKFQPERKIINIKPADSSFLFNFVMAKHGTEIKNFIIDSIIQYTESHKEAPEIARDSIIQWGEPYECKFV